jgi:proton glutamate symport protein
VVAILIGLALVNLTTPGIVDGQPAKDIIGLHADVSEIAAKVEGRDASDVVEVFLRLVPPNIVSAAADQGQMLGLIVFSLLFGYFMRSLRGAPAETLKAFWQGVFEVMMGITDLVMRFAPLGVFALVAKVMADSGLEAFRPLAVFFLTVLAALALHAFGFLPLMLKLFGLHPARHYRAMAPAMLTAFSTASSSGTLPVTMECVEKNAGVSNRVTSFVLPLGATINMDGTALYECVAAMFIAQAYGLDLGFAQQFSIVVTALLTSVGVAGIPAASLVAITIILANIGLPAEGIGLILAVDRVLDMCRTSVNVFSDSCGAVIIGRLEGEQGILGRTVAPDAPIAEV